MFLKLIFNKQKKKLKFKEDLQDVDKLRELICSFKKWNLTDFDLVFSDDEEGESNPLQDNHDMEYMLEVKKDKKFVEVHIIDNEDRTVLMDSMNQTELIDLSEMKEEQGNRKEELIEDINNILVSRQNNDCFVKKKSELVAEINEKLKNQQITTFFEKQKSVEVDMGVEEIKEEKKELSPKNKPNHKVTMYSTYGGRIPQHYSVFVEEKKSDYPESLKMKSPKTVNKFQCMTRHTGVSCDNCSCYPIVGRRFKCAVCFDFDICENCEEKGVHNHHPMARFLGVTNNINHKPNNMNKATLLNLEQKEEKKGKEEENYPCIDDQKEKTLEEEKMELLEFISPGAQTMQFKRAFLEKYRDLDVETFYEQIVRNVEAFK